MFRPAICKIASVTAVIAAISVTSPEVSAGEQHTGSSSGTALLPSGVEIHYQYHFGRNRLKEARSINGSILALTSSGNILEFDESTLGLRKEWYFRSFVTCLGQTSDGSLLAGFEDGRVCSIDLTTRKSKELARVPGRPQWVAEIRGALPGRPRMSVLAVSDVSGSKPSPARINQLPRSLIYSTAEESRHVLPTRASAFLLDSTGRLWVGADNGEWGGWCSCFDTQTGRLSSIPGLRIFQNSQQRFWRGVFGFAEVGDGEVWAFGGVIHFTQSEGFIWRVDRGTAEELYRSSPTPPSTKPLDPDVPGGTLRKRIATDEGEKGRGSTGREPAPAKHGSDVVVSGLAGTGPVATQSPRVPITQVFPGKGSAALTIIALKDAFTAPRSLARWSKFASIPVHIGGGRIDSGGPTAPIKQVLGIGKNNVTDRLILVT